MKVEYKGFIIYKDKNGKIRSYKPGNNLKREKENKDVKDITSSFKKQRRDKKNELIIQEGIDEDEKDIEIKGAKWLLKKRGGKIVVLKEDNSKEHKGKKNPDYNYNDKLWDWKENKTSTSNAVKNLVKDGARQIRENPGGIVVDVSKSTMDVSEIKDAARNGTRDTKTKRFITVVKKGDKIIAVYNRK